MIFFGLLGPVEVHCNGAPLTLGPAKQRQLLVRLLLARGHGVGDDELTAELWADQPPASSVENLRLYVSKLRALLCDDDTDAGVELSRECDTAPFRDHHPNLVAGNFVDPA